MASKAAKILTYGGKSPCIHLDEKTYGSLNLAALRDKAGIDFAHFTYTGGMCSCCYFPTDFSPVYWAGKGRTEKEARRAKAKQDGEYSYILFKNASNGSGQKTRKDVVCKYDNAFGEYHSVFIEWSLSEEQLNKVCTLLQEQLGSGYEVIKPESEHRCIEIRYVGEGVQEKGESK